VRKLYVEVRLVVEVMMMMGGDGGGGWLQSDAWWLGAILPRLRGSRINPSTHLRDVVRSINTMKTARTICI